MTAAINLRIIIVSGGLPGGIQTASGGGHEWRRSPGEARNDFIDRVTDDAERLKLHDTTIVIGGLGGTRHAGNACRCRACRSEGV
jgi:hypothetical protein